jgi:hypothetical protein
MTKTPFAISGKRRYAVDLASLKVETEASYPGSDFRHATIRAVWFRRKDRVTAACLGYLRDYLHQPISDVADFLARSTDGRYGGMCEGRWDGTRYWGAQEPETIEAHLQLLRPMLDAYPEIPEGFDGWWVYER